MGLNLVLQWLGMAAIAAGIFAVFGWPYGLIVMGIGALLVGIAGEVGARGIGLDDERPRGPDAR